MDRIVSAFAIMFALSSGALASYVDTSDNAPAHSLPSVRDVLPILPTVESDPPVYTTREVTIEAIAPSAQARHETRAAVNVARANDVPVWTCGSPRALSIGSGSVRECSYVASVQR